MILVIDAVVIAIVLAAPKAYLDLEIYRIGADTWLAGGDLYGKLEPTSMGVSFPFTYPPVAAVLFTSLLTVPFPVAAALVEAVSLALLALVLVVVLGRRQWLLAAALLPLAVALEPVRSTLHYGQINLLLLALVTLDCLAARPRWPRGVLVGLAAAIKLTPAVFVLFFLFRRDFRAALTAAFAFLGSTAAGFLLAWDHSVRFWTVTLFDTGRIGNPHYAGNQSLLAVLARFGLTPPGRTVLWLLGVAAVLAITGLALRRALAAGNGRLAFGLTALAVLVISPVSWSHHWVWAIPALLCLPLVAAGAGVVILITAPQWWFPNKENVEYEWSAVQQLLGNSYVYFAVLVLAAAAVPSRLRPRWAGPRTDPPPCPASRFEGAGR